MDMRHAIASVRFGLGRRPDEPLPDDPAAWLEGQLRAIVPQREVPGLPPPAPYAAAHTLLFDRAIGGDQADPAIGRDMLRLMSEDAVAWVGHCLLSDVPFQDRLTNFWMNHFTVSRRVRNAGIFVGPYLREVIRPHQFGKLEDMLLAVARDPGMLVYLSNNRSIGPNSRVGQRGGRGLNENLAREILELHTVSPASGYTQADVTGFARILTGWTTHRDPARRGFQFRPEAHEPGPKTLLGRTFPEGEEGGVEALRFLARHPAAHRHLATRLARHFVADDPPRAAIDRLYAALRDSGGDLGAVSRALVRLPEAWSPPLSKVRDPFDYVLGVGRALDGDARMARPLAVALDTLGQRLWSAPQPVGWSDTAEEWAVPEALLHRIEWANAMAGRAGRRDPRALAQAVLGPLASTEMLREAARAGSPQDALTLVLVSPEFQRR